MCLNTKPSKDRILEFLLKIDMDFPVPISEKQDLNMFAEKLYNKATICAEFDGEMIVAMVAGYTENTINKTGYISIVGTLKEWRGKGFAPKLISDFLQIARETGEKAVHVYTVSSNTNAVTMYRNLGFVNYKCINEERPNDLHLIYYYERERE